MARSYLLSISSFGWLGCLGGKSGSTREAAGLRRCLRSSFRCSNVSFTNLTFKIAGSKPYNNQMRKMLAWCAQNVLGIVGAAQLKHYTSTLKSNFSITNWIKLEYKSKHPSWICSMERIEIYIYTSKIPRKTIKQMYKNMKPSNFSSWSFCTFYMPKGGTSESWHPAWVQFAISELLDARHLHEGYSNHVEIPGPGRRAAWLSSDFFAVILNMAMKLCDL